MTPTRWQIIETLYHAALELAPDQRVAYLKQASSDDALRHEVETLLAQGVSPLDRPLIDAAVTRVGVGTRLGPYEVKGLLGAGGMGEVFRATDTRLGREVAIKTSEEQFGARFEREIKAISSLNHPNICTLFDVGPNYLVMELVDGETLASRLKRGGLSMGEALHYGSQIADALAAAHAKGIVHRDLKPGNIMVASAGVKVLDFGLAKIAAPGGSVTLTNTVMGTPAYMAPEQVEAKAADARTDLFAFGLVLYEMAAGQLPFPGAPLGNMLVSGDVNIPPPSKALPGIPAGFDSLVSRLLAKDPAGRPQTAAAVRDELSRLAHRPERVGSRRIAVAAAVLALAAGGLWVYRPSRGLPPIGSVTNALPVTAFPGNELDPSFSPDGNQVAFTWSGEKGENNDIYIMAIGSQSPRRLTDDPADDEWPAWSPDGTEIAFLRRAAVPGWTVMLVPVLGGAERKLGTVRLPLSMMGMPPYRALTWTPDSKALVLMNRESSGTSSFTLLPLTDGRTRVLRVTSRGVIGRDSPAGPETPAVSPSGRWLAFIDGGRPMVQKLGPTYDPSGDSMAVPIDSGENMQAAWLPGDRLIVSRGENGTVSQLLEWDLEGPVQTLWAGRVLRRGLSVNAQGGRIRVVTSQGETGHTIWALPLNPATHAPSGPATARIRSPNYETSPDFSKDGQRLAFISSRSGTVEIWLADAAGGHQRQLSPGAQGANPRWFKDGKHLVYVRRPDFVLMTADAESGIVNTLPNSPKGGLPEWSSDGNYVYAQSQIGKPVISRVRVADGTSEQIGEGRNAQETWDGKRLIYLKQEDGLYARSTVGDVTRNPEVLLIRDYVDGSGRLSVSRSGAYYLADAPDGKVRAFRYFDFATGRASDVAPAPFETRYLAIAPSQKELLYSSPAGTTDLMMLEFGVSK